MSRIHNLPDAAPRLQTFDGAGLGIRNYGIDNGYPQRMLNLYNASPSAKMCAELCATYLIGKGFPDKSFYSAKINDSGLTPDKLLRRIADDKSKFRGFYVQFNYNGLYQKESIHYVPFEKVRIGINEHAGKFAIYDNWYSYSGRFGTYKFKSDVKWIHNYNLDPLVIQEQVEEVGGWENYNGQLLFVSDDFDSYPLASIDSVIDDTLAEIESSKTRRNNLANNFQLKGIWVEKGKVEDSREEQEVVEDVKKFMGPEGAGVSIVFSEAEDLSDVPEFKPFTNNLNDKLFQYTDQKATSAIYKVYKQPAVLHSDYFATNGFNADQLPQCMAYYNSVTEPARILFEEVFEEIFLNYKEDINPSKNYTITPLTPIQNGNTINNQQV